MISSLRKTFHSGCTKLGECSWCLSKKKLLRYILGSKIGSYFIIFEYQARRGSGGGLRGLEAPPWLDQKFCATPKICKKLVCSSKTVDSRAVFPKTALKSTVLELQTSFLHIFGVAQNFWSNGANLKPPPETFLEPPLMLLWFGCLVLLLGFLSPLCPWSTLFFTWKNLLTAGSDPLRGLPSSVRAMVLQVSG